MKLRKTVLTERESLALRLKDEEGLNYREIGECLGCGKQRASQIVLAARARLAAHEERGPNGFSLLPGRAVSFLNNNELGSREEVREAIESGRIYWGKPDQGKWGGEGLCVDGHGTRNAGWETWVILCEWTGQAKPTPPKKETPPVRRKPESEK